MVRAVTVEIVQAGQPRPCADSIYEGYITFSVPEGQIWASKVGGDITTAKQYVKLMLRDFAEPEEVGWWLPRLTKMEQVSPLRWHAIVTSPYTD